MNRGTVALQKRGGTRQLVPSEAVTLLLQDGYYTNGQQLVTWRCLLAVLEDPVGDYSGT